MPLQYGAEWDQQSETNNVLPLIEEIQATLNPYFAPERVRGMGQRSAAANCLGSQLLCLPAGASLFFVHELATQPGSHALAAVSRQQ